MKQVNRPGSGQGPRRLSVAVGVAGLIAMAMLTLLLGRSTTHTRSATTMIAAPANSTATRTAPSAAPGWQATPWAGQGWLGDNWYNVHKGQ